MSYFKKNYVILIQFKQNHTCCICYPPVFSWKHKTYDDISFKTDVFDEKWEHLGLGVFSFFIWYVKKPLVVLDVFIQNLHFLIKSSVLSYFGVLLQIFRKNTCLWFSTLWITIMPRPEMRFLSENEILEILKWSWRRFGIRIDSEWCHF